jgi:oligopeptide/dipeptide ABC transporter ATP-binding protein
VHLLDVEELRVSFDTPDGVLEAVRGLSFHVDKGETLGLVGESGAGKSVAMQAVLGLLDGAKVSGSARFEGQDLISLSAKQMQRVLGREVAVVFQDPSSSLHPLYRVGWQIEETIRAHTPASRSAARKRAIELLDLVGIPSADRRVDDYPHQFSGGMRQRVMIAMAIALNPALLIADEPTTALDVTVQAQILDLLAKLQREFHMAIAIITHDLGVIAEVADRILVMYAGKEVEQADAITLFRQAHHPYTRGLIESLPEPGPSGERLRAISGQPPNMLRVPSGCSFHPRCSYVMDICKTQDPPLEDVGGASGHRSACWLPHDPALAGPEEGLLQKTVPARSANEPEVNHPSVAPPAS